MESTVSVSKGVFLFNNGGYTNKQSWKNKKSLFDKWFQGELWSETFKYNWQIIEEKLKDLHHRTYDLLLIDLVNYIRTLDGDKEEYFHSIIPSATLLTGVNQPDHVSQFATLINKLRDEVSPHIAMVHSEDAITVKQLIENVVWQLIYGYEVSEPITDEECDNNMSVREKLKKNQCTMTSLQTWYESLYSDCTNLQRTKKKHNIKTKKSLIVIIPDFESFNYSILQDFVLIVSSYTLSLPVVLVFGVATSVSALHKSFPYHVSSKLLIKVFQSHSSPIYMNQVLEEIFLSHECPFQLSGKAFELLTDVFLFYDFSVTGFIQGVKYCMMEHFYDDNVKSLCCEQNKINDALSKLGKDDLEDVRRLMSFRPYLEQENCFNKISLLENDNFFKESLRHSINGYHDYMSAFYTAIRILCVFVKDLPKNVLGKSVREIYATCSQQQITQTAAFKESIQLLNLQSQVMLVESIKRALDVLNIISPVKPLRATPKKNSPFKEMKINNELFGQQFLKIVKVHLLTFLRLIQNASQECTVVTDLVANNTVDSENVPDNRYKLKEKLLRAARVDKIKSEFEMVRSRLIDYLEELFDKSLQPPYTQPFYEIFVFDDISSVRKQIVGSPRGAVHTALTNANVYLQCSCCALPDADSVAPSLPDLCVAYKLLRECGAHANLYDWLQAFAAVRDPGARARDRDRDREDARTVPAQIQTRFTRAVAELQFLGFIKSSKRKTDHVMRLTW